MILNSIQLFERAQRSIPGGVNSPVRAFKSVGGTPISVYNISGEYAMIKAAAERGWIDENKAIIETLTSIKRAGGDLIATYFAKDAARLFNH